MTETKLRPRYHKGHNEDGKKSVALEPETYRILKIKADELDVTIKSLLTVVVERHVQEFKP